MITLKQRLFSNWHLMRIVRLILSVVLGVMAYQGKDAAMGGLALFFLITTITGVGCCGPQGCSIPDRRYREMMDESNKKELNTN